jgi:hypothetical protein
LPSLHPLPRALVAARAASDWLVRLPVADLT